MPHEAGADDVIAGVGVLDDGAAVAATDAAAAVTTEESALGWGDAADREDGAWGTGMLPAAGCCDVGDRPSPAPRLKPAPAPAPPKTECVDGMLDSEALVGPHAAETAAAEGSVTVVSRPIRASTARITV